MQNCFLNHLCLLYQACGDRYIVHAPIPHHNMFATTVSKQLSLSSLDARLTICILIAYLQYFCVYIYTYTDMYTTSTASVGEAKHKMQNWTILFPEPSLNKFYGLW